MVKELPIMCKALSFIPYITKANIFRSYLLLIKPTTKLNETLLTERKKLEHVTVVLSFMALIFKKSKPLEYLKTCSHPKNRLLYNRVSTQEVPYDI